MHASNSARAFTQAVLGCGALFYGLTSPGAAQDRQPVMTPQVAEQIQAIIADKKSWSAAQAKMHPSLLYASRVARGLPPVAGAGAAVARQQGEKVVNAAGVAQVEISTSDTREVVARIQSLGGSVVSVLPDFGAVLANVPAASLEILAGTASIRSIQPAEKPATNRMPAPPRATLEDRLTSVRVQLAAKLGGGVVDPGLQTNVGKGATVSEAVLAHGANIVQNTGVTGAGVKVCVISDGVSTIATRTAAGELPVVQILGTGQASTSGDEGTAMLELVADMAPGASLGFSTGNGGKPQMAQNILDLRNVMGCNIIVDDLTYFSEAAFQEDVIANAVTTVVNSGAMYFSSAANSGRLTGGNSGTWEGDFVNGGVVTGPIATAGETGFFHNFGGSNANSLTTGTSTVSLKWSEPLATATSDYDLFILNSAGTSVVAFSAAVQNGTQDPFELVSCTACPFPSGSQVVVVQFSGAARALRVDTHRGRLATATSGSTFGHNGGINTIAVAAVSNPGGVPISGRKFLATDAVTTYSSDGPRKLFLNPTPATTYITPGCALYSCGGGVSLPKVDIAAADCNVTTTPGFSPFCGTSAAAPQAAGIAALVKSAFPGISNAEVLTRMRSTAIDIMATAGDRDSGLGIVMADGALNAKIAGGGRRDFNADSKSDILWRGPAGEVAEWQMNGTLLVSGPVVAGAPLNWIIVGSGDFNGDGKTDVLWRGPGGEVAIWLLNGATLTSGPLVTVVSPTWTIAGVGDFNGDGKSDILWRGPGGEVAIWFMNGASITSGPLVAVVSGAWTIAGTGDFDSDGKSDVLWRGPGGEVAVWFMNGAVVTSGPVVGGAPANWNIIGAADLNGDGRSDIVWRGPSGEVAIWFMNGATLVSGPGIATVSLTWTIAGFGDFNGDGKFDLLWRGPGGEVAIWAMDGPVVVAGPIVAGAPLTWTIQAMR